MLLFLTGVLIVFLLVNQVLVYTDPADGEEFRILSTIFTIVVIALLVVSIPRLIMIDKGFEQDPCTEEWVKVKKVICEAEETE